MSYAPVASEDAPFLSKDQSSDIEVNATIRRIDRGRPRLRWIATIVCIVVASAFLLRQALFIAQKDVPQYAEQAAKLHEPVAINSAHEDSMIEYASADFVKDNMSHKITQPKSVRHPIIPQHFLIHDMFFYTPYDLIFVTTLYDKDNVDFSDVQVTVDGRSVTGHFTELTENENILESIRQIRYSLSFAVHPQNTVTVTFNGNTTTLKNVGITEHKPKDFLTVATLIGKPFQPQLALWLAHYRKQGVTRFELYFLGESAPKELADMPASADTTYHHWDFVYLYSYKDDKGRPQLTHHAQVPLINMLGKRLIPETEWLLLCDLDELIFVNNVEQGRGNVKFADYLRTITPRMSSQVVPVHNAKTVGQTALLDFSLQVQKSQNSSKPMPERPLEVIVQKDDTSRKGLYHRSYYGNIHVHTPSGVHFINTDIGLAHMVEIKHPDRLQGGSQEWTDAFPLVQL